MPDFRRSHLGERVVPTEVEKPMPKLRDKERYLIYGMKIHQYIQGESGGAIYLDEHSALEKKGKP